MSVLDHFYSFCFDRMCGSAHPNALNYISDLVAGIVLIQRRSLIALFAVYIEWECARARLCHGGGTLIAAVHEQNHTHARQHSKSVSTRLLCVRQCTRCALMPFCCLFVFLIFGIGIHCFSSSRDEFILGPLYRQPLLFFLEFSSLSLPRMYFILT